MKHFSQTEIEKICHQQNHAKENNKATIYEKGKWSQMETEMWERIESNGKKCVGKHIISIILFIF